MEYLEGLDQTTLVEVVKATQRHRLQGSCGSWAEYLQAKFPRLKLTDPSRHPRLALIDFLESLGQPKEGTEPTEADLARAAAKANFVCRYVRWMKWQEQVQPTIHREPAPAAAPEDAAPGTSTSGASTDQASIVWDLVHRTQQHARYLDHYTLPSYNKGWAWTRKRPSGSTPTVKMLAMDCEMVKTNREENALVALCLVDETGAPVYQVLVKPKGKILDYRTFVTGLTAEDFEGVTLTRQEARKAVKKLLRGAVLVGHSLCNDLRALRLDHRDVIDTALLFTYKDLPFCTPSLKDLAKTLLNLDMRKGEDGHHDALEDAAATMQLVMHQVTHGNPPMELTPPEIKVPKESLCKLMVHSLPDDITIQDFQALFGVKPPGAEENSYYKRGASGSGAGQKRKRFDGGGGTGTFPYESIDGTVGSDKKIMLVFKNPLFANAAFKSLPGTESVDNIGRATKLVPVVWKNSSFKVRKMACHNGLAFGIDRAGKARAVGPAKKASGGEQAAPGSRAAPAARGGKGGNAAGSRAIPMKVKGSSSNGGSHSSRKRKPQSSGKPQSSAKPQSSVKLETSDMPPSVGKPNVRALAQVLVKAEKAGGGTAAAAAGTAGAKTRSSGKAAPKAES